MENEITELTYEQATRAFNTISSNTFYYLVGHLLKKGLSMSVVRMGDGEKIILNNHHGGFGDKTIAEIFKDQGASDIAERLGYKDTTVDEAAQWLLEAVKETTFFAPNIAGIHTPIYDIMQFLPDDIRISVDGGVDLYVDNFFVNEWCGEKIVNLCAEAKDVAVIAGNDSLLEGFKNRSNDRYTFHPVKITHYRQVPEMVERVLATNARMALLAAPKTLGPKLSERGLVSIDVGNSIDRWAGFL